MAKLADLIKRAIHGEPAALGFGSGKAKRPATMLLVALASKSWRDGAAKAAAVKAVAAGADALLFSGNPNEKELTDAIASADGRPCGVMVADDADIAALHGTGADFVALSDGAPAAALQQDGLLFVLRLRDDLTDIQLRTVDPLNVAAVYVEAAGAPLTIARQMEIQRVAGLVRKPVLYAAPADASQEDLVALREAGVSLLAVDMASGGAAQQLEQLRGVIDKLPRRDRQRGQEAASVSLPSVAPSSHDHDDEEEDE